MQNIIYMLMLGIFTTLTIEGQTQTETQTKTFPVQLFFFKSRPFLNSHFIKGEMSAAENEIRFVPGKLKMLIQEITINCSTVQSIKPVNDLGFIPNKLRITLYDGTRYTFFARHRNKRLACLCK